MKQEYRTDVEQTTNHESLLKMIRLGRNRNVGWTLSYTILTFAIMMDDPIVLALSVRRLCYPSNADCRATRLGG